MVFLIPIFIDYLKCAKYLTCFHKRRDNKIPLSFSVTVLKLVLDKNYCFWLFVYILNPFYEPSIQSQEYFYFKLKQFYKNILYFVICENRKDENYYSPCSN